MTIETEVVKIQLRRGTSVQFDTNNPVLSPGEAGYEVDTGVLKLGDGTTDWHNLMQANQATTDAILATVQYQENQITGLQGDIEDVRGEISQLQTSLPLLSPIYLDYKTTDPRFIDTSTFSWQPGVTYKLAYDHLVADIEGKTLQSEVCAGYTIYFYLAEDLHKICMPDQEGVLINLFNEQGKADYYILDTSNNRFKFPRCIHGKLMESYSSGRGWCRIYSDGFCEQGSYFTSTAVGDSYVQVNLIKPFKDTSYIVFNQQEQSAYTGSWGSGCASIHTTNRSTTQFELSVDGCTNTTGYFWVAYGYTNPPINNSPTKYLFYYVGDQATTALFNTAGLNMSLFNNKADRDLNNIPSNIDYIVQSWRSGYNFYRIYKSGWCEQGGIWGANNGGWTGYNFNFHKTFASNEYLLFLQGNWSDATASSCRVSTTRTPSGVTGAVNANNQWSIMPSYWYAVGQLAVGQY